MVRSCAFCGSRAQYRDRTTGDYVCLEHARLTVVATGQSEPGPPPTDPLPGDEEAGYPSLQPHLGAHPGTGGLVPSYVKGRSRRYDAFSGDSTSVPGKPSGPPGLIGPVGYDVEK